MTYEELKTMIKKVVNLPKTDIILLSDVAKATRKTLEQQGFNDEHIKSSDMEFVDGYWYPKTYSIAAIVETSIIEVAKERGYVRGYEDGSNPERDFSNILLSKKRAAKKPYIKWPKGKFTEIPNGVEREQLIATIIEGIDVEIPVNVKKLEAQIREAMLQKTGYLYTWNVLHGWEVLISQETQRVYPLETIACAATWRILRRTGLKEVPTTDPRMTIIL